MATFGEPPTDLVGIITPVIRTMFGKLSKMAQVAQTNGIFLYDADKITLSVEWMECFLLQKKKSKKPPPPPPPVTATTQVVTKERFQTFTLQSYNKFEDNVEKYLDAVHQEFVEQQVVSFLENKSHAQTYPDAS